MIFQSHLSAIWTLLLSSEVRSIKRPLVTALVFLIAGILLGRMKIPAMGTIIISLFSFFIFIFSLIIFLKFKIIPKKQFIYFLLCAVMFLYGSVFLVHPAANEKQYDWLGKKGVVAGRIDSIKEGTYSYKLFLDDCVINGKKSGVKIYIDVSDNIFSRGDIIECKGVVSEIEGASNEGAFDMKVYYNSIGVGYYMKNPDCYLVEKNKNKLIAVLEKLKHELKNVYKKTCDKEDSGVFEAMILGDKSDMDTEIKNIFSDSGIGHILAISGLHVSIIGMGMYKALRKVGTGYLVAALISGFSVVCFSIMTGNSVSAIRATIMFVCSVYAKVIGRKYDILSAVSLAAILILISSPYMIENSGFLLSFLAIAGVTVVSGGFVTGTKEKWTGGIRCLSALTSGLSITLATMPVMLWFYYDIPVYAPVLNLLVIPLMTIIMISALLTGIMGFFSIILGRFCSATAHYILLLFRKLCGLSLSLPGSVLVLGRPKLWQIVLYYIGLFIFSNINRSNNTSNNTSNNISNIISSNLSNNISQSIVSAGAMALRYFALMAGIFFLTFRINTGFEVDYLDVGQGDAVFINLSDGRTGFIDGGSSSEKNVFANIIKPFLSCRGIKKIDYLFLTHNDEDHYSGWLENDSIEIGYIFLNVVDYKRYQEYKTMCDTLKEDMKIIPKEGNQGGFESATIKEENPQNNMLFEKLFRMENNKSGKQTRILSLEYGQKLVFDDVSILALNGKKLYDEDNDNSLVLLLEYLGNNFLFTGDISSVVEEDLAESLLKLGIETIDVIKVAHHGSKYSSSEPFLTSTHPVNAIISCSIRNSYRHPAPSVIERLETAGSRIYYTMYGGQIKVKIGDGKPVITEKK